MFDANNFQGIFKLAMVGFFGSIIASLVVFVLLCFGSYKVFDIAVDYFEAKTQEVKEQVQEKTEEVKEQVQQDFGWVVDPEEARQKWLDSQEQK